ncbi:hypothetical protein GCM10010978_18450 [Compostibacillus humi]|uniref:Uncharacterized protein n=1 Tax=Compostibacillus humi TaxID=1245525 RepID=A0A8J2TLN7_9BACI|nr:hypothetical protein [Compostibacillus humi]GFZ77209.1 hypothetical protein GCM10010978_18450 [Compostibacillus humi]HLT55280.1 hypothetical protein [Bacillota bacterium]
MNKENPWKEYAEVIAKHLEKNEKWFQAPEKKFKTFEKNAEKWNSQFLKDMAIIEKWIKKLEKKMEE